MKRSNTTARMLFALEYDDQSKDKISRPTKVYYHFTLYDEDGELVGDPFEGVIINPIPPKS